MEPETAMAIVPVSPNPPAETLMFLHQNLEWDNPYIDTSDSEGEYFSHNLSQTYYLGIMNGQKTIYGI